MLAFLVVAIASLTWALSIGEMTMPWPAMVMITAIIACRSLLLADTAVVGAEEG